MAKDDPHFRLRIPADLKARVEESAKRNHRSVNAEIVQALTATYPPEPSVEDLLDTIHRALEWAKRPDSIPYRKPLVEGLEALERRVASGLEFDQFRHRTISDSDADLSHSVSLHKRWHRAIEDGVEQADLERELANGIFNKAGRSRIWKAIQRLKEDRLERAMMLLGMGWVKFAEPAAAKAAIEANLREFYRDNWGDPDKPYIDDD